MIYRYTRLVAWLWIVVARVCNVHNQTVSHAFLVWNKGRNIRHCDAHEWLPQWLPHWSDHTLNSGLTTLWREWLAGLSVVWSLYWNLIKLYLDWKEQGQGTGKEELQIAILEKIVTVLWNGSGRQNYHLFSVYHFTVELEKTRWLLDWYLLHIRFSRLCNKFGPSNLHALVSFESFLNLYDVQLHPSSQYPLTFSVVENLLLYTALALTCGLYSAPLHPASLLWWSTNVGMFSHYLIPRGDE